MFKIEIDFPSASSVSAASLTSALPRLEQSEESTFLGNSLLGYVTFQVTVGDQLFYGFFELSVQNCVFFSHFSHLGVIWTFVNGNEFH